jgi:hypothetical protein
MAEADGSQWYRPDLLDQHELFPTDFSRVIVGLLGF